MDSESVVCGLAAAKSIAVQSSRELRVIGSSPCGVIATRIGIEPRRSVQVDDSATPRDLMRQPVRLETTTTRQNCGENPRFQYLGKAHGRFVPGVPNLFRAGRANPRSGLRNPIGRRCGSPLAGTGG